VTSIPGYEIEDELARGGAGVVYRARDLAGERVALKVLVQGGSAGNVARFRREVAALSQLNHPGIVRLRDAGETPGGQRFLVMGLVDGAPLSELLLRGPLPITYALELAHDVAEALAAAHRLGVVHRDVKPANVIVTSDGRPLLTDFGLAMDHHGSHSLTAAGAMLGTPGYMPPEQGFGELTKLGPPADVYALGATLYACLAGRPPFEGAPLEVLAATADARPRPPSHFRSEVSPELDALCLRCLAKDPDARFSDGGALAEALSDLLAEDGALPARRGPGARWPLALLGAAGALLLAALVLWPGSRPATHEPELAEPSLDPARLEELAALEREERPQAALALSEPLLQRFPDHPRLLSHVGRERVMFGRVSEGLPLLRRAVDLAPDDATVWLHYAVGSLSVDRGLAREAIDRCLSLEESAAAYAVRARLRLFAKELAAAERDLARAEALDPSYPHLASTWAVLHVTAGRIDLAIELLDRRLAERPVASAHVLRAQLRHQRGDSLEAVLADCDAALALTAIPAALEVRARALAAADRWAEAEETWSRYLAHAPRSVPALCARARLRAAHLGRAQGAVDDAKLALAIAPERENVRAVLALVARSATEAGLPDACSLARRWVELSPGDRGAFETLVEALWYATELEELIERTQDAERLGASARVFAYRGAALFHTGRLDEAGPVLESALRRDPGCLPAYAARAELRLARGQFADARDDAEAVLAASPTAAIGFLLRGLARMHLGDTDEARADLLEFERFAPGQLEPDDFERRRADALAKLAELEAR